MIVIEDMSYVKTHKYFEYGSIFRAINHLEYPIFLWDSTAKSLYDVYDEIKPDLVMYYNPNHTRAINKLNIRSLDYNEFYKNFNLISDVIGYKKIESDPNVACDNLCIAPFPDVEEFNTDFFNMMDKKTRRFRYFGPKRFGGHKDCGDISESYHCLFLSSATNVLCLSKQFAVNAYLCNDNLTGATVTKEEVENCSSLRLIKEFI